MVSDISLDGKEPGWISTDTVQNILDEVLFLLENQAHV